jgi:plasmid maintenance system killer protein
MVIAEGNTSIRINKQWPVCFKWKDAFEVEIVDYH